MADTQSVPSASAENEETESYASEVIKCLTQMREQREHFGTEIMTIESEKRKVEAEIRLLTTKLARLSYRLAQKMNFDNELKKTIEATETAYAKLVESSQNLYKSVKQTKDHLAEQNNKVNEKERAGNMKKPAVQIKKPAASSEQ